MKIMKMDKSEIMKILEEWNFWKKDLNTGVDRDTYASDLKKMLPSEQIKIVTGARRSGKSYILRQLARHLIEEGVNRNNILMVNFEDPRFVAPNTELLGRIFDTYHEFLSPQGTVYLFLDEIQEVPGWEKWVRTLQELGKANMVISGSNARLLSHELATVLTGRHLDMTVLPLSFREFLKFKGMDILDWASFPLQNGEISSKFREFLESGSFPLVVLEEEKEKILLSYFDDSINKDLVRRYRIRKSEKLKSLVKFYLSNIAAPITFGSSGKFLEISKNTVEKFSGYLESAYLVFFLKRFSFKVKEQENSPRKVYSVDTGLSRTVGFRFSENIGKLAENVVFLELKRRAYHAPDREIFYWKNIAQEEVDFVIQENAKVRELIQVCWDIQDPQTKKRETRALLKALDEFGQKSGLIITDDFEGEEDYDGRKIRYVTLRKWLLDM